MDDSFSKNKASVLLIFAAFFWGTTFPFTKALTSELSVLFILAYRFLGTTIILFFLAYPDFKRLAKKKSLRAKMVALGFINLGAIYLQTLGLTTVSSANAGFVTALSVLFVPLLDMTIRKHPIQSIVKWSLPISLCGIYFMSFGFQLPQIWVLGDFWIFLSAWFYAVYILLIDDLATQIPANLLMTIVFFITSVSAVSFFFIWERQLFVEYLTKMQNPRTLFLMWFLIIGGTVLPYTFMVRGQKYVPAQQAALIYLFEPVFATILAAMFFSEKLFFHTIIGASLILFALLLVILRTNNNH